MPGTYSQIYLQVVFAIKGRQHLIAPNYEAEVYQYMAGIIRNKEQKPIAINGMPDHVHLLIGLRPVMRISDLVRDVKNNTSNFIQRQNWGLPQFCWQEGYGVFSYSESNFRQVAEYIHQQKEHHRKRSFREEYVSFLKKFNVPFESKYLFEFYEGPERKDSVPNAGLPTS
jgi:REP element-mobilizing transposase RayT